MSVFARARHFGAAVTVALAVSTGAAGAATYHISSFDRTDAAGALAARDAYLSGTGHETLGLQAGTHHVVSQRTETFAGHQAWNGTSGTTNPANTNVGSFSQIGSKAGHGLSAINGGTGLEVRSDTPWRWGRQGLLGDNWLDSNDTHGIKWDVSGNGSAFNSLSFFLTDAADVGGKLSIRVGGELLHIIGEEGRTRNGTIHFVTVLLPDFVDNITVKLRNDMLNDGFGFDGATVAHIAPVPLPPAAALLLAGVGGLVLLRRRARPAT